MGQQLLVWAIGVVVAVVALRWLWRVLCGKSNPCTSCGVEGCPHRGKGSADREKRCC